MQLSEKIDDASIRAGRTMADNDDDEVLPRRLNEEVAKLMGAETMAEVIADFEAFLAQTRGLGR
jgi:hypothetical protein